MSTTIPGDDADGSPAASSWWQRNGRRVSLLIRWAVVLAIVVVVVWRLMLAPVAVITHTVGTGAVTAEIMGTGTLEARTSAIVGPKIGGLIVSITADQGDHVKAGALLFRLEDSDIRQQVKMAGSEIEATKASLDRQRAGERRSEAVLTQAKQNHERLTELRSTDLVAQQDLDRAYEALKIAEAELSTSSAAIIEGQTRLHTAEQYLDYQRARLQDTTIEAPFDALVVRRDKEHGDVVSAGSSVLQLVSTKEMWITAWVDETELSQLGNGQSVRVVFRSQPGSTYEGVVARVGLEVDRETREIIVDVRVEQLPAHWAVGQRAEVYIQVAHRDAVTFLPAALLLVRDARTGVMLDEDGKAVWREITVGLRGREVVEITDGLSPGDVVVSRAGTGSATLRDGRSIKPE